MRKCLKKNIFSYNLHGTNRTVRSTLFETRTKTIKTIRSNYKSLPLFHSSPPIVSKLHTHTQPALFAHTPTHTDAGRPRGGARPCKTPPLYFLALLCKKNKRKGILKSIPVCCMYLLSNPFIVWIFFCTNFCIMALPVRVLFAIHCSQRVLLPIFANYI